MMLSADQVCARLGVSRWTVQRLVRSGHFRGIPIAGRIVYDAYEIDSYVAGQREAEMPRKPGATIHQLLEDLLTFYNSRGMRKIEVYTRNSWTLHLGKHFSHVAAKELTTSQVQHYRISRTGEGAKPATVNRELQTLRRAYKIGARCTPPKVDRIPYFEMARENNARKTFLSPDQLDRLRSSANNHSLWLRTLVEMAYIFGWRIGEMLALRVRDVDLAAGTVRLETSKNGEAREVPMTEGLRAFVVQLVAGKSPNDILFVSEPTFRRAWEIIKKDAGVSCMFHDFRRTSARSKRAAGIDTSIIMAIQGWKTEAMFRRYAITSIDDKRQALSKLA